MKRHSFTKILASIMILALLTAFSPLCLAAEANHTDPIPLSPASGLADIDERSYTVTYITENDVVEETVIAGSRPITTPALPPNCTVWRNNHGYLLSPSETDVWADTTYIALPSDALSLTNTHHIQFMDALSDGLFHPYDSITRADAAKILFSLMQTPEQEPAPYPDLPLEPDYSRPVGVLGALGLLRTAEDGTIRPLDPITRAEFAWMVSAFLPKVSETQFFVDVPAEHWACDAVNAASAQGLFGGYADGTFRPEGMLSRAETAVVIGRLLGRTADQTALLTASDTICILPDVPSSHWAYAAIMEAIVSHEHTYSGGQEIWTSTAPRHTTLPDGFHSIGGRLYQVQNGMFLHGITTSDGFTFDSNGRYTTGLPELDAHLSEIVASHTNSSMSRDEKLHALYNYVRDNYKYLKRGLVSKEQTNWEPAYALEFFQTKMGNCFSYAAAYCLLARQVGVPAYTVVGKLKISTVQDHGWVEMILDGTTYLFDTELEWSYLNKYNKQVNLFKIDIKNPPYTYIR